MKRNSATLFLESPGATTPIPWVNNTPDFSAFSEPTLSVLVNSWNEFLESGQELEIVPDPEPPQPTPPQPDWQVLQDRLLGGDLYFIYSRIRMNCFVSPSADTSAIANANNVAMALGLITDGVLTVRIEAAVADAINLLINVVGYQLTEEEKAAWNAAVSELNFSELMVIP